MRVMKSRYCYRDEKTVEDEVELASVIQDHLCELDDDNCGVVEKAERRTDRCAEAIGKLISFLVDRNVMTFDEAKDLVGYWQKNIRPVE